MIVYSILNQHSGKRYIGYTTKGLKKRRHEHLSKLKCNRHVNAHLQSAWNRGDRYLLWIVLEVCSTIKDAKTAELVWIAHYNTTDNRYGYNLTHGGEGGIPTQEVRDKIGSANRGRIPTQETRQKMSESHKGKRTRPCPPETRAKMSAANKGQVPWNKGHRRNSSTANATQGTV